VVDEECTADARTVDGERRRLVGLAYRMLGTVSEAEDAVQEAYLRWYRLDDAERQAIANPAGWLTRVTSRICLDMLGSARARHERYVGQWLPEPVPENLFAGDAAEGASGAGDPLDRVTLDESVSTALLVVLESMTPAERVAFILHDVFGYPFDEIAAIVGRSPTATRQLASSARRRVRSQRSHPVDPAEHARLVRAFGDAANRGDIDALTALLDPAVSLRSDGGGVVKAALNPITGAAKAARFLLGVLAKQPTVRLAPLTTADGPALALVQDDAVTGVVNLQADGDHITRVWIQWNPHKLTLWSGGGRDASPPDASPGHDRMTDRPRPA
jgi:RNA polymerase sigma-70 factor (ECF subfamily)